MSAVWAGLKGTYQGLTATVLKQGSNQAIRFYVMTSLRNWYKGVCVWVDNEGNDTLQLLKAYS